MSKEKIRMTPEFAEGFEKGAEVSAVHAECESVITARQEFDRLFASVTRRLYRHVLACPKTSPEHRAYAETVLREAEEHFGKANEKKV